MTQRTKKRLTLYVFLVGLSALAGPLYGYLFISPDIDIPVWRPAVEGAIGGAMFWTVFMFYLPTRRGDAIRRSAFLVRLIAYCAFLFVIIVLTGFLGVLIVEGAFIPLSSLAPGWTLFAYVGIISFLTLLGVQVGRMIGPRILAAVLIGRYHTPVSEDRVFLFVDVADSTGLATRLGDLGVQRLLSRFFFDIGRPVLEHRGEIHAYVGDEAIITWPTREAVAAGRCVRCFFDIQDTIAERAEAYRAMFGAVPKVRAGLHGGNIVVSECGDLKRSIVYFGDTINTAARIEEQAKQWSRSLIVSGALLDLLTLPPGVEAETLGPVLLRGHEKPTALFSLARSEAA